jgi:hypothetical protein
MLTRELSGEDLAAFNSQLNDDSVRQPRERPAGAIEIKPVEVSSASG